MNPFLRLLEAGAVFGMRPKAKGRDLLRDLALLLSEFWKIRFGDRITTRIIQMRWFIRAPPEFPSLGLYNP